MSIFGRKRKATISSTVLSVRSLGFMGSFSRSPNGSYIISWERTPGAFVLCLEMEVQVSGRIGNPFQGAVSDCGVFALESLGQGSSVSSTLRVFNQGGHVLLTKRFPSHLDTLGLSNDGSHVACQLLDGDVVLIELEQGKTLWKVPSNPTGSLRLNSQNLTVDTRNGWVILNLAIGGNPRISFSGEHLDADVIRESRLRSAHESPNGLALVYLVREEIERIETELPEGKARELLKLLDAAHEHGFKGYPDCKAKAYRAAGEILEASERPLEALDQYRMAIEIDPEVGVKRRLAALERMFNNN